MSAFFFATCFLPHVAGLASLRLRLFCTSSLSPIFCVLCTTSDVVVHSWAIKQLCLRGSSFRGYKCNGLSHTSGSPTGHQGYVSRLIWRYREIRSSCPGVESADNRHHLPNPGEKRLHSNVVMQGSDIILYFHMIPDIVSLVCRDETSFQFIILFSP